MSKYEKYKSTGVEWIGEIPEDWRVHRIKSVSKIISGSTPSSSVEKYWDGDVVWFTPGDFSKNDRVISTSENNITEEGYKSCGTTLVPKGSIILTTRAPIGNVLIADLDLCTNQGCKSIIPTTSVSSFLYYIFSISQIELNVLGQGTTFLELSREKLSTFKIPFPDKDEQLTIANYLDHQTQKIDRLIANKKAQAEKLKELRQIEINNAVTKGLNSNVEMKDSGIDWLGKIPKHWELKRLKNLANQISEKSIEILDDDFLVALENIESNTGKFIETASEYENNGIKFKKGNLLYNKLRPYLNKVFQADKDGVCVGDIIVIECTQRLHPTFLQYRMLSDAFCSVIMSSVYGAKMPRTSWQFISSLKIGYPSFDEQVQITEHLNKRTIAIENLIQNINLQIDKLQELRKIKIYEAVTGKIKVNAYVEATA
ncbi:MAG: restriction endonuclease subunit S [Bacteroidota bacterium]